MPKPTIKNAIVVDCGSRLRFFHVNVGPRVSITAYESVADIEGRRAEIIADTLKKFTQRHSVKHHNVILSAPLRSFFIRRLELPWMPEKEIAQALRWQMKDDVPFNSSQALVDYVILNRQTHRDGAKALDIICAIADNDSISILGSTLQKAGFKLISISLMPFGYASLFEHFKISAPQKPSALVHIGETNSLFMVYLNNELRFFRELPISAESLKQSFFNIGVGTSGKDRLTSEEVEEILFTVGVPAQTAAYKNIMNSMQILSAMRPFLERVVNEVKRTCSYYETQLHEGKIENLFISGIGSCILGLDGFLSQELALKTTILHTVLPFDSLKQQAYDELGHAAGILGLVSSNPKKMNLILSRQKTEVSKKPLILFLFLIGVIVAIIFAVFSTSVFTRLAQERERLRSITARFNSLSQIKDLQEQTAALETAVVGIKKNQCVTSRLLKLFNDITPPEILLQTVTFDQAARLGTVKGMLVVQQGNPTLLLTEFMRRLEESKLFKEVNLKMAEKKQDSPQEAMTFTITLRL